MLKNYFDLMRFRNFKENKSRVDAQNRMGISLILMYYSCIELINILSPFLAGKGSAHSRGLALDALFILIVVPLFFLVLRKRRLNFTLLIYLVEIPILLITMWHGTFEDPDSLTITFLLCLLVLPELILDKPWRIAIFTLGITVLYIVLDAVAKPPQIFARDLLHVANACLMSISVSLYVLAVRIQNNNFINIVEDRAQRDPLTGLYNRYGGQSHFKKNEPGLLIFMDLDRFKDINDEFGHSEGDHALQETARALQSCFRKEDVLIRLGGDEFAIFAPGTWTKEAIQNKLEETLCAVDGMHLTSEGHTIDIGVTASIGCVYAPNGAEGLDPLIRVADKAMYGVKRNGKNSFSVTTYDGEAKGH